MRRLFTCMMCLLPQLAVAQVGAPGEYGVRLRQALGAIESCPASIERCLQGVQPMLQRVIEEAPGTADDAAARQTLGYLAHLQGDDQRAIQIWLDVVERFPPQLEGVVDARLNLFRLVVLDTFRPDGIEHVEAAEAEGLGLLEQYVELFPHIVEPVLDQLGLVYTRHRLVEHGAGVFDQWIRFAAEASPQSVELLVRGKVDLLMEHGHVEAALAAIAPVARRAAGPETHLYHGDVLRAAGEPAAALAAYEWVGLVAEDDPCPEPMARFAALATFGSALALADLGQNQAAVERLDAAYAAAPAEDFRQYMRSVVGATEDDVRIESAPADVAVAAGMEWAYQPEVSSRGPVVWSVHGFAPGLAIDADSGRVTVDTRRPGRYDLVLTAHGLAGAAQQYLHVVVGDAPASAGCGDGLLAAGEGCEDGNLGDGDGCSATCEPAEPCLGDVRADGRIDILDIQSLVAAILRDRGPDAGDLNGDGRVNILDAQAAVAMLLLRVPARLDLNAAEVTRTPIDDDPTVARLLSGDPLRALNGRLQLAGRFLDVRAAERVDVVLPGGARHRGLVAPVLDELGRPGALVCGLDDGPRGCLTALVDRGGVTLLGLDGGVALRPAPGGPAPACARALSSADGGAPLCAADAADLAVAYGRTCEASCADCEEAGPCAACAECLQTLVVGLCTRPAATCACSGGCLMGDGRVLDVSGPASSAAVCEDTLSSTCAELGGVLEGVACVGAELAATECDCTGTCRNNVGPVERVNGPATSVVACVNATIAACRAAGETFQSANCAATD